MLRAALGLKVSRGRVPTLVNHWEGAAVPGVLTHDVADTAAVLDLICGPDPLGWYNAPAPERPFIEEVGAGAVRLRVGLMEDAPLGFPKLTSPASTPSDVGRRRPRKPRPPGRPRRLPGTGRGPGGLPERGQGIPTSGATMLTAEKTTSLYVR